MKIKLFSLLLAIPLIIFLSKNIMAHCPLCVVGAGAAGAAAMWLGVSQVVVALFIGAFAMSMGMWFAKIIKKKYIPLQNFLIVAIIFFTTVLPLMPLFKALGPLYLSFIGDYGTTYIFNYSLASSFLGGLIVLSTPLISKSITKKRNNKTFPFQGTLLTLVLLIIIGVLIQISLGDSGENKNTIPSSIELLPPEEFEKVIQNESIFLLNVHTPYSGKINGTDETIEDWENLDKYMEKLPMDVSVPIAVYCRSGKMSADASKQLLEMGYQNIYELDGGMTAWEESGKKII
ncbi:MAG TPA: rhodanese-like domain-containing protein [Candidatus Nanoarchaeia archaeon]|nr:rhodanese-like domain-containing protein [Candidatus Nanoarchaeia archaeon]